MLVVPWKWVVPPPEHVDKGQREGGRGVKLAPRTQVSSQDTWVQASGQSRTVCPASNTLMPTETQAQIPPHLLCWPPAQTHCPSLHEGQTTRSNNSLTPNGHTLRGQSLGAEATEIQLHRNGIYWFFYIGAKVIQQRKSNVYNKWCWSNLTKHPH